MLVSCFQSGKMINVLSLTETFQLQQNIKSREVFFQCQYVLFLKILIHTLLFVEGEI